MIKDCVSNIKAILVTRYLCSTRKKMCLDSIMRDFDYLSLFFAGLLETTCNLVWFLNFVTFSRLAKEQELLEFKMKAEEMEKENLELATQLAKKEAELDVKTQVCKLFELFIIYFHEKKFIIFTQKYFVDFQVWVYKIRYNFASR